MVRKVVIKINKGIKMFGKPLRDGEINELNTRQIFKLMAVPAVREIWEFNEEETYKRQIFLNNYKDENPDWEKVGIPVLKDPVKDKKLEPPVAPPIPNKVEPKVPVAEKSEIPVKIPKPPVTESILAVSVTPAETEDKKEETRVENTAPDLPATSGKEEDKKENKNNKKNKK